VSSGMGFLPCDFCIARLYYVGIAAAVNDADSSD
jgi:hypothetical protein